MPWNEGGGGKGVSQGGTVRSGTRRGRVASEIWEPLGSLAPGSWSMLVSGPAVGRWAGSWTETYGGRSGSRARRRSWLCRILRCRPCLACPLNRLT